MRAKNKIKRTFRLRQVIAKRNFTELLLIYFGICLFASTILALPLSFLFDTDKDYLEFFYAIIIELMGEDYEWELSSSRFRVVYLLISLLGLSFPTLLLGTIVFKIFVLHKDNLVFRDKVELGKCLNGENCLNIYFYICTSLRVINLNFRVFLITYEKDKESGLDGELPMNTHEIDIVQSYFPLPYAEVPSVIKVPLPQKRDSININYVESSIVVGTNKNISVLDEQRNMCMLAIVGSGEVPDLQTEFREVVQYELPNDLALNLQPLRTVYIKEKNRFKTENWEDFIIKK